MAEQTKLHAGFCSHGARRRSTCFKPLRIAGVQLQPSRACLEELLDTVPVWSAAGHAVAESGIASTGDLRAVALAGFDAALIGTSLLLKGNPGDNLKALLAGRPIPEQAA